MRGATKATPFAQMCVHTTKCNACSFSDPRQMFGGYGTQAAGLVDARVLAAAEGWVAWLPMAWGMHEAYERGMLELMNR